MHRFAQIATAEKIVARFHKPSLLAIPFIGRRVETADNIIDGMNELDAESGRYGDFCEFTQAAMNRSLARIDEIAAEIEDQLADWDNS